MPVFTFHVHVSVEFLIVVSLRDLENLDLSFSHTIGNMNIVLNAHQILRLRKTACSFGLIGVVKYSE